MSGQPPEPSASQNGHENAPSASSSSNALRLGNRVEFTIKEKALFVAEGTYMRLLEGRTQRRELGDLEER